MARYSTAAQPLVEVDRAEPLQDIEDMAVSPLSPSILASVSMDHSVRFWSLDPAHEKQPCMLICAGEGHKEGILTMVSFSLFLFTPTQLT